MIQLTEKLGNKSPFRALIGSMGFKILKELILKEASYAQRKNFAFLLSCLLDWLGTVITLLSWIFVFIYDKNVLFNLFYKLKAPSSVVQSLAQ